MKSTNKSESRKLSILGVILLVSGATLAMASAGWHWYSSGVDETPFTILRDKILTDPTLLDGAEILDQKMESGLESYLYVELRLATDNLPDLNSPSVIKYCVKNPGNCTEPAWISYDDYSKRYPPVTLNFSDEEKSQIICTGHWDYVTYGEAEIKDSICLNRSQKLLWYQY